LARPDFRGTAARRLSEERELSPAIISLLSPEGSARATSIRQVPVGRIDANPDQPRLTFDEGALAELSSSVKEHGVLQPILVRPHDGGRYQLIAGERRWRAAKMANLETIPAMIEEIDDDTALEIAIIENLQREDLSPLDEAIMYDRMTSEHGYSVRKLAQKLGKDKGYIENRLRLADAPPEIRELVSLRKDTVSHAYELLKVEDPRKRRRLAEQVASGELSLVRLREKIEGRRSRGPADDTEAPVDGKPTRGRRPAETDAVDATAAWTGVRPTEISEDSLISAKGHLAEALDELVMVLRSPEALDAFGDVDRGNLAKYLTISKLKLENAIAMVRSGTADREG
jgi:ParB family chromosome partitioning protein